MDVLVDKTAAANSSLGIDLCVSGITHDFPITNFQRTFPGTLTNLTYVAFP